MLPVKKKLAASNTEGEIVLWLLYFSIYKMGATQSQSLESKLDYSKDQLKYYQDQLHMHSNDKTGKALDSPDSQYMFKKSNLKIPHYKNQIKDLEEKISMQSLEIQLNDCQQQLKYYQEKKEKYADYKTITDDDKYYEFKRKHEKSQEKIEYYTEKIKELNAKLMTKNNKTSTLQ